MTHPSELPRGARIPAGLGMSTVLPEMDFETYSEAGFVWDEGAQKYGALRGASKKGLPVVGTPVYATHPSTEVLSLAYNLKDGTGVHLWIPGMAPPADLLAYLAAGGLIEAWNSAFEWWVWNYVCVRLYGWPPLPIAQTRCAAGKARASSWPGKLEIAGSAMPLLVQKDKAGHDLLKFFSVPRVPTKKEPTRRRLPAEYPVQAQSLYQYNGTDTVSESEASARCPDLEGEELEFWLLDQVINRRGVAVNVQALHDCAHIVEQCVARYNAEMAALTGGIVSTELQQLKGWLLGHGVRMAAMDEEAIDAMLPKLREQQDVTLQPAIRALELRQLVGSASVKKVFAMLNQLSPWGRLHDLFIYHGARTGRCTGEGPQPLNLPKAGPNIFACTACGRSHVQMVCPWCGAAVAPDAKRKEWTPEAAADVLTLVRSRSVELLQQVFGDAMHAVSGCLRSLYCAAPGHTLVCSDFSSIEGVVTAALAGEDWRVEMFATHGKAYELSVSKITGTPFAEIMRHAGYDDVESPEWWTRRARKDPHHPMRQTIGKVAELASGFGGGVGAWKRFGADAFMSDEQIATARDAWRAASPAIVEFWGGQERRVGWHKVPELYGLEGMFIRAILEPSVWQHVLRKDGTHTGISYVRHEDAVYCRLPSGRLLTYHRPRLVRSTKGWGGEWAITYEGYNTNATMGGIGWVTIDTYGGKLAENCLAAGTLVLTREGWTPIEQITPLQEVWDGIEWVQCDGAVCNGRQPTIEAYGARMTADHLVLTSQGWKNASQSTRYNRADCRLPDGVTLPGQRRPKVDMGNTLRVQKENSDGSFGVYETRETRGQSQLRVHARQNHLGEVDGARHEPPSRLCSLALDESALHQSKASGLGELRRPRHHGVYAVAGQFRGILGGHGPHVQAGIVDRAQEQQSRVHAGQHDLGDSDCAGPQSTHERQARGFDGHRVSPNGGRQTVHDVLPSGTSGNRQTATGASGFSEPVYDVLNAGPRNRFVIWAGGAPLIVHNCVQATARDILRRAMLSLERAGYPVVLHVYDEIVCEVPEGQGHTVEAMEAIMGTMPEWAVYKGKPWPVRANGGWMGTYYRKA